MDDLALPIMGSLLGCLCAELSTSPGGETCFCSLYPGGQVVADNCTCKGGASGCGQAWVRFVRSFPSKRFPNQDADPSNGCSSPQAAVLELGVYRCMPVGANGAGPTAVQQTQATVNQMGDWTAIRRAMGCCGTLAPYDMVAGAIEVRSQGGCGGPVGQVTIRLSKAPR